MRRLVPLVLLAVLASPSSAPAAPAKISPRAPVVSDTGVASVEVANPNAYVLRGSASVTVGTRTIAKRSVRLGKRSVSVVRLRFDRQALTALRTAQGRATLTLRVRRSGGRTTTARRTLTLRLPSGAPQNPGPGAPGTPTPAPPSSPAPPSTPAPPTSPASNRWVGRLGSEGAYDDLELTVTDGQLLITNVPTVAVVCFENGGAFRSAASIEIFDAPGPWTVGTDGLVAKQGIAVNRLVSSGARSINYKVTETTQDGGRLTGMLGMSFFDSRYDIFTNKITFINCAGSQSFEAVPG
jgi:hypothetical protein